MLSAVFLGAGALMAVHVSFENTVNTEVQTVLRGGEYEELELVEVSTEFTDAGLVDRGQRVTVVVARPSNGVYPFLAEDLGRRIESATGRQVVVEVEYIERQTYGS